MSHVFRFPRIPAAGGTGHPLTLAGPKHAEPFNKSLFAYGILWISHACAPPVRVGVVRDARCYQHRCVPHSIRRHRRFLFAAGFFTADPFRNGRMAERMPGAFFTISPVRLLPVLPTASLSS